jgi:hypothetical protein
MPENHEMLRRSLLDDLTALHGHSFGHLPLSALLSFLKAIPSRNGFNWFCLLSELLSGSGSGNLDDKLAFAADYNLQTKSDLKKSEQKSLRILRQVPP